MTILTAPSQQIIPAAPGEVITITLDATSAGFRSMIGPLDGDSNAPLAKRLALVAGSTLTLGPWASKTRHNIECSVGTVTVTAGKPAVPKFIGAGRVVGFTGALTLSEDYNGLIVRCDDASSVIITVPGTLSEGFNVGFLQWGAGTITLTAGSGATNRSGTTGLVTQYSVGSLVVGKNVDGLSAEYFTGGQVG